MAKFQNTIEPAEIIKKTDQERLNRSLLVCQDKFEAAKLQEMKTDATQELESCVNRFIDDSIRVLPHVEQINSTLVHRYTRLITAASASSPVSLRALLPIHARAIVLGVSTNPTFATSLLAGVAPASLAYARMVFDAAPVRMWNTLLHAHAHSQSSHATDTLALYKRMRAAGVAPDHYTYPIVLPACAAAREPWLGRAAHGDAVRFALAGDGFVRSALIAMYFQEGEVADAELVFAESHGSSRTVVS